MGSLASLPCKNGGAGKQNKIYNMKVRKVVQLLTCMLVSLPIFGQSNENDNSMKTNSIRLAIKGGETFTATLVDNSSADALMALLSKGDVTVEMEDYGNMEKVGPLGTNLPRNDRQTTTGPGDIILYQGKYLVIYYSTNSWNFTRIGRIDNADGTRLKSALGKGNVTVTLSSND